MKNWIGKGIKPASWVAAALLLFGLEYADEGRGALAPRLAAAQSVPAPATRLAAAAATQSPAPGKPRIGGTLKFGIVKDIGTPIPFVAYTSVSQYAKDNMYEPLVMNDPKGEIHPGSRKAGRPTPIQASGRSRSAGE